MRRTFALLAAIGLALALPMVTGCKSGRDVADDPILRLSAEESLVQGKEFLAQGKYARARPYFTHTYEVEPNSAIGREGLLLAADTYFQEGGTANFIQAEAKYRDFLNRFPTSQQASYVQFQIANSLAERMEKPDRDQTVTRKALEAYDELLRLYPTSEYSSQAELQKDRVRSNLAEHEFVVGRFYLRYGIPGAAVDRFEYLLSNYPQYNQRDKAMYHLGLAYQRSGKPEEAKKAFDRLQSEFPESSFAKEIPATPTETETKAGR